LLNSNAAIVAKEQIDDPGSDMIHPGFRDMNIFWFLMLRDVLPNAVLHVWILRQGILNDVSD
jgi:hypothetical protein